MFNTVVPMDIVKESDPKVTGEKRPGKKRTPGSPKRARVVRVEVEEKKFVPPKVSLGTWWEKLLKKYNLPNTTKGLKALYELLLLFEDGEGDDSTWKKIRQHLGKRLGIQNLPDPVVVFDVRKGGKDFKREVLKAKLAMAIAISPKGIVYPIIVAGEEKSVNFDSKHQMDLQTKYLVSLNIGFKPVDSVEYIKGFTLNVVKRFGRFPTLFTTRSFGLLTAILSYLEKQVKKQFEVDFWAYWGQFNAKDLGKEIQVLRESKWKIFICEISGYRVWGGQKKGGMALVQSSENFSRLMSGTGFFESEFPTKKALLELFLQFNFSLMGSFGRTAVSGKRMTQRHHDFLIGCHKVAKETGDIASYMNLLVADHEHFEEASALFNGGKRKKAQELLVQYNLYDPKWGSLARAPRHYVKGKLLDCFRNPHENAALADVNVGMFWYITFLILDGVLDKDFMMVEQGKTAQHTLKIGRDRSMEVWDMKEKGTDVRFCLKNPNKQTASDLTRLVAHVYGATLNSSWEKENPFGAFWEATGITKSTAMVSSPRHTLNTSEVMKALNERSATLA